MKKIDNNILEWMSSAFCNALKCKEISYIVKKVVLKYSFMSMMKCERSKTALNLLAHLII